MGIFYLKPGKVWEQNHVRLFFQKNKYFKSYERIIKVNVFFKIYILKMN